ncbi:Hypp7434 [Branchiostoma lanceolatum]|uniref:Hypp7434 protein n=1 Tax=Branchiostoma lanceolatum TaxID=7740 RepID=A0A8J9Z0W9_BRALA|nr:Hypp7434 [Branchiostoma lanceolatum]
MIRVRIHDSWFHGPLRIILGRMPLRPNSDLKMRPDETEVEWVERIRTWYKAMWRTEKEKDERRRRELKAVTQCIGDYFRRAKRLGVSWVAMAAELGLTPVDVAVIKTDSGDIHEQIERVIYQWRYYMVMDGFSMNITVDSLIDFLEESLVFYDLLDYLNKTAFKTIGKTWVPKYEVPARRLSQDVIKMTSVGATYRAGSTASVESTASTDSDLEADL